MTSSKAPIVLRHQHDTKEEEQLNDTASSSSDSDDANIDITARNNTTSQKQQQKQPSDYWYEPSYVVKAPQGAQHGKGGVFYGGNWLDIEDCDGQFIPGEKCSSCEYEQACRNSSTPPPRSQSRNAEAATNNESSSHKNPHYDVLIIGAGCIGAAIARELSRYSLRTLWLEAADDVSQGATKGNSGIVHAGYDDKPGTNRAKFCWKGNQMFAQLDRELRFGYQKNGSLVVAFTEQDKQHLEELKKRGETNGVQFLRIVDQRELRKMEPHINPDAIAALYSPDAGNVIPYEFAIALAENAVDNGVELRIRREVQKIEPVDENTGGWKVTVRYWEPRDYVQSVAAQNKNNVNTSRLMKKVVVLVVGVLLMLITCWDILLRMGFLVATPVVVDGDDDVESSVVPTATLELQILAGTIAMGLLGMIVFVLSGSNGNEDESVTRNMIQLVERATKTIHGMGGTSVEVNDMLIGGSGSSRIQEGVTVAMETVQAKYIINCAGGASDQIARMIGDKDSFKVKPRIGDYILLNRNQGHLAKHTLFPCPDPVLGKGVLVQTTLWSNLILGPTARDMHNPDAKNMTSQQIQDYILERCKKLVPSFTATKETIIHTFCGARAKTTRGDWIIEPSKVNPRMIHVAGIDSPGLAGSPAIALEVVRLLKEHAQQQEEDRSNNNISFQPNKSFNPHRSPIITPKSGMKGLKFGPVGKNDGSGSSSHDDDDTKRMASNVICKCERVTELEVVRAIHRSLPVDSTQAIRKRTRAGMGHCQGDPQNYNCEARVKAILARELHVPLSQVGGRPWPATSILKQRWQQMDDEDGEKSS